MQQRGRNSGQRAATKQQHQCAACDRFENLLQQLGLHWVASLSPDQPGRLLVQSNQLLHHQLRKDIVRAQRMDM